MAQAPSCDIRALFRDELLVGPIRSQDSPMNPGPTAHEIQNHLYTSFLQGSTADVALRVHGSWNAIYNLHRVVLIQSGFFRSLFTAGFLESSTRRRSFNGPEEIVIRFDDPNISRAAFEICISRLYGGGPPLDISPYLIPSSSHPLTTSFPSGRPVHKAPQGHHPATPRFLLSLLATAVYLSIPSLASQALTSILNTIGPYTVLKYLNFALGEHIGFIELEHDEPQAAVGLEHVAQEIDASETASVASIFRSESSRAPGDVLIDKDLSSESASAVFSIHEGLSDDDDIAQEPSIHYGGISNKIGEACTCWLARWGVDLLPYEEKVDKGLLQASISRRKRSWTIPALTVPSPEGLLEQIPRIWSRGGLTAKWAAAVISSDTFCIKSEKERYSFACRLVELRRRVGVLPSEEQEWEKLFEDGIYYANIPMDDLIQISRDISPTTNQPFLPLAVIQAAFWSHSLLQHHIMVRPPVTPSGTSSPPPRDKELGITQKIPDLLVPMGPALPKFFFPVPGNSSVRIGDDGTGLSSPTGTGTISMDHLFTSQPNLVLYHPSSPTLNAHFDANLGPLTTEAEFFGLAPTRCTLEGLKSKDTTEQTRWSPYPPYRFAVEFWDLNALREKKKLFSQTVFYAGSLFNVFVQVIARKKGQIQLGIYLHRQSSIEPIPAFSMPFVPRTDRPALENEQDLSDSRTLTHNRGPSLPTSLPSPSLHYSPSIHPVSTSVTPNLVSYNTASSPSLRSLTPSYASNIPPATSPGIMPAQAFRDPRPSVSAYFSISCASLLGSSQTRFSSTPDVFHISKSWGWKSSSLIMESDLGEGTRKVAGSNNLNSFRATIVMGLV